MVGGVNLIGDWRILEAWWAKRGATKDEVGALGVGCNFDPLYVCTQSRWRIALTPDRSLITDPVSCRAK